MTDLVVDSGAGGRCCNAGDVVDGVQSIRDGVDEADLKLAGDHGYVWCIGQETCPFRESQSVRYGRRQSHLFIIDVIGCR